MLQSMCRVNYSVFLSRGCLKYFMLHWGEPERQILLEGEDASVIVC